MSTVRILAMLLAIVPAVLLGYMSGQLVFPAVVCAAALVGVWDRIRPQVSQRAEFRIAAAVALLFFLRWLLFPAPRLGAAGGYTSIGVLDYARAYPIAQALLVWQVALLFLRRGDNFPRVLPIYAILAMVMAGTFPAVGNGAWRDIVYQTCALGVAVITGAYFSLTTPRRAMPDTGQRVRRSSIVIMAVVLFLGWALGTGFYRYGDRIDQRLAEWLSERNAPTPLGFPDNGRIGRINSRKIIESQAVAMRIMGQPLPGYLRGKAYDTYYPGNWSSSEFTRTIAPLKSDGPKAAPSQEWFAFGESTAFSPESVLTIDRAPSLDESIFSRLESTCITSNAKMMTVDRHDIPLSNQVVPRQPYCVAGNAYRGRAIAPAERTLLTSVPENLDPRIQELAAEITTDCRTDRERMNAIAGYVHQTCTYDLNSGVGKSREPVSTFLFETHRGHCELFASAVTLLLRCANVPCRYTTGFLVTEQNAFGGYWVARNKDAHAWVEVWLDDRGWETLEATPPSGVPREKSTTLSQFWEYAQYAPKRLMAFARSLDMDKAIAAAERVGAFGAPAVLAAAFIVCAVVWKLRGRRRLAPVGEADAAVAAMHELLAGMDRTMAARGLVRSECETLHGFASRIEAGGDVDAAAWYRLYAEARYGAHGDSLSRLTAARAK